MNKVGLIITVVSFLLFGLACGFIGITIGEYSGRARAGQRGAEHLANAVYRGAKNGDFESIVTDKLASEGVADSLKQFQKQKGAVKGWRVLNCYVTPVGLPTIVTIEVQRNKTEQESLVIHAPSLRFDSHGDKILVAK